MSHLANMQGAMATTKRASAHITQGKEIDDMSSKEATAAARIMGKLGGSARSPAKAAAARANGMLGGRPKKQEPEVPVTTLADLRKRLKGKV